MNSKSILLAGFLSFASFCYSDNKPIIRLGTLAFGTVNWELAILQQEHMLDNAEFTLQTQALATPQAGKIALQSGAVDIIISDWIWVSQQRSIGRDLSFYPYSSTAGAFMVHPSQSFQSPFDLKDKKLGIAGGELDKNWLLLQALAQKNQKLNDLMSNTLVFGAPPLLNQQLLKNNIDAVMTYWHFAAKLEAEGYQRLTDSQKIISDLGINEVVPTLGYVFNNAWAKQNKTVINQFLQLTQQAKQRLCHSDSSWQTVIPFTREKDPTILNNLRKSYCQGLVSHFAEAEQQAAEKIYQLLRVASHSKLTGESEQIQPGTFWNNE